MELSGKYRVPLLVHVGFCYIQIHGMACHDMGNGVLVVALSIFMVLVVPDQQGGCNWHIFLSTSRIKMHEKEE